MSLCLMSIYNQSYYTGTKRLHWFSCILNISFHLKISCSVFFNQSKSWRNENYLGNWYWIVSSFVYQLFYYKENEVQSVCNSLPFSSVSVQCTLYTVKRQGIMERPLDERFKKQLKCNGAFDQKYNYIVLTG